MSPGAKLTGLRVEGRGLRVQGCETVTAACLCVWFSLVWFSAGVRSCGCCVPGTVFGTISNDEQRWNG